MKIIQQTGIALLAISFIIGGCKKRDDENFQATTNNAEALIIFDDINNVLDEAASGETDLNKGLFPKVTPNTYAAESEIHIKDKKLNTI